MFDQLSHDVLGKIKLCLEAERQLESVHGLIVKLS